MPHPVKEAAPRARFPHPLTLLVLCILAAAALTWVLPAGEYERREDPATERNVVVAGTYRAVAGQPVGPFDALVAIPRGIADAAPALALWIWGTMRHAARTRTAPEAADLGAAALAPRDGVTLALIAGTFALYIYGAQRLGWDLDQLSALRFFMGVVAGIIGGLRVGGTAEAFVDGFRLMALAALLIGFARAICIVLADGQVVDTIVHGLFTPIAGLPVALSAVGMMTVHAAIHVPVPSPSSQAVLTMPLLVPLSDLIGLSRQVTVLAYQYGAGLCEVVTPTNGALMAMLAAAGVRYEVWLRFAGRLVLGLALLGAAALAIGTAVGLG